MLGDHLFFQGYKGRSIEKFTATLLPIMGGGDGGIIKKLQSLLRGDKVNFIITQPKSSTKLPTPFTTLKAINNGRPLKAAFLHKSLMGKQCAISFTNLPCYLFIYLLIFFLMRGRTGLKTIPNREADPDSFSNNLRHFVNQSYFKSEASCDFARRCDYYTIPYRG